MRSRPRTLLALATTAAAALAGCGATVSTSGFHGEARNVAQTISDLQTASGARDEAKLCNNILARAVLARLEAAGARDCRSTIKHQLDEVDNTNLSVVSNGIEVKGKTATARVKDISGGKTHYDTLQLVHEDGRWKVSGLVG